MRNCNQIDLIVSDVPNAARFFRDVVGLTLRVDDPRFAELDGGAITIMLSPDALIPIQPASGIILHIEVEDVSGALEHARAQGLRYYSSRHTPIGVRNPRWSLARRASPLISTGPYRSSIETIRPLHETH